MIQRQQTLWLLLAVISGVLSFIFPFYEGIMQSTDGLSGNASPIDAGENFYLILSSSASIILAAIVIFLYKKRKQQLLLCIAGIVLSLIIIILFFSEMKRVGGTMPSLSSVFVFVIPVCYIMAARGVWKDQKLVKSLDKLR